MSGLTPKQIFNGFKNKELDKATAVNYLKSFIENSSNEALRIESLKLLGEIGDNNNSEIFKILEHLILSDSSELIRTKAAILIIKKYLTEGEDVLKWTFEHETSVNCLIEIFKILDHVSNKRSRALINRMERDVGKKYLELYDISSRDAMVLELIAREATHCDFNRGNEYYISFKLKNKETISLNLRQVDFINSDILSLFPSLRELRMIDCFPGDLTGLKNLTTLKISRFEYTNLENITDIKGLDTLVNLEHLDLSGNYITKIKGLDPLTNLKELDLSWNSIKEIRNLEGLIKLEVLRLQNTGITQIQGLDKLIMLKELDLSLDSNYDICIDEIIGLESLRNLEYLDLSFNRITEIKGLENLKNLKSFYLKGNKISIMKGFESLIKLEILDLSKNEIREIKGLNNLKNLQKLYLQHNQISELKNLEKLTNLKKINLNYNKFPLNFLEKFKGPNNAQNIIEYCYKKQIKN